MEEEGESSAEQPANDSFFAGLSKPRGAVAPVVVVIAAVLAAFSDAAPTGTALWDVVLKAVLAALVVYSATRAPAPVIIVMATVGAALVGSSVWLVPAGLGLILAIGGALAPLHREWTLPLAAGLALQGLLRIPAIGFFGLPSLIAGAAIGLLLFFGYRAAAPPLRRRIIRIGGAVAVLAGLICGVGGLVLLSARSDVERGINAARGGLSAARDGDPEEVVAELEEASDALTIAEGRARSLLAQPLRLIPVAAQHRDAVVSATRQGSAIARQASRATIEADISSITMSAGSVDLSALAAMEPDLVRTVELLDNAVNELATTRSQWLLSPIANRMDSLTDEMRSVLPEAQVAADAARVLPGLMGLDEPRHYFVAFGSPAESRELGGFIGSWALLEIDAGTVRQLEAGRIRDLYDLARANAPLDDERYPSWYINRARPTVWPQNLTRSPQLSTVAAASQDLLDGLDGQSIDGFVYLDSYVLGALLELTGPINIEGVDHPINARNADSFFFDEQYRLDNRDTLKSELGEAFAEVFDKLLDVQLPGPERLGRVLGPVARQGRLQVATFDDAENAFLQSVKLQRDFSSTFEATDSMALVQSNGSVSKLDLYLHRDVTYDIDVADDGRITASVAVVLSSDVPDDAPAYALGKDFPGINVVNLSLYTRHGLTELRVDGEAVGTAFVKEFGFGRYETTLTLPANTSHLVEYDLVGQVSQNRPYQLSVWQQPLVNNDMMHIRHQHGDGPEHAIDFELVETTIVEFDS